MRTQIHINLQLLQQSINDVEKLQEWTNHITFFTRVAEVYNENISNDLKPINAGLVRLRWLHNLVSTNVKPGKKGRQKGVTITTEHIDALKSGRKKHRINVHSETVQKEFRARYKDDPTLISMYNDYCKKPSVKKMIKINCIVCMGGFKHNDNTREAVRKCSSPLCMYWPNRGYK